MVFGRRILLVTYTVIYFLRMFLFFKHSLKPGVPDFFMLEIAIDYFGIAMMIDDH